MKGVLDTNTLKSKKTVVDNPCSSKLLFITLLLFFLAAPVSAASPDVCKQYADSAMNQLQQAKDLGISGLNPPTWSDNYALHLGWCLTAPDADVKNGTAVRQAVIDEYKNIPPATSTAPFIPKSPQMEPVQAEIVTPGADMGKPGIGKTSPNAQLAAKAKVITRFSEHCYDGPGHCLWVIPHAEYRNDYLDQDIYVNKSENTTKKVAQSLFRTHVDIQFPTNKETVSYVCAFVSSEERNYAHSNNGNWPDLISIKNAYRASLADANEGLMPNIVSSFGECSVTEIPESIRRSGDHFFWTGTIIIVSQEPMFVSAHTFKKHYGNAWGMADGLPLDSMPGIPYAVQNSFLGGESESAITPYAVDCRKPSGYEGVCGYAKKQLEKIN